MRRNDIRWHKTYHTHNGDICHWRTKRVSDKPPVPEIPDYYGRLNKTHKPPPTVFESVDYTFRSGQKEYLFLPKRPLRGNKSRFNFKVPS